MVSIDKAEILKRLLVELDKELQDVRQAYEEARRTSIEAPGRMQSRYDTMGIEAAWVADGLAKKFEEKSLAVRTLEHLSLPINSGRVTLGCIAAVGPEEGKVEAMFFILPVCGGVAIPTGHNGLSIQIVTPGTPVGKELIRKVHGDMVNVRKNRKELDQILLIV